MSESAPVMETGEAAADSAVAKLVKENEELIKELDGLKDRHARLQAEFENFRKRKAKESEEIREYASARIIFELLMVMDHFELALHKSHDRTDPNWGQGIDLIAKQITELLRGNDVSEIAPERGDAFNHDEHEAIGREEKADMEPGVIVARIRKGYKLKQRLLRPAQVVISCAVEEPAAGGEADVEA